jgi:hypothetical protein
VTAELAVAMPAVTVVLAAVLAVGQAVLAQVACLDAARAGARAAARGDALEAVRRVAGDTGRAAGSETAVPSVAVDRQGGLVTVTVSRPLRLLALGPALQVRGSAVAQSELPVSSVVP